MKFPVTLLFVIAILFSSASIGKTQPIGFPEGNPSKSRVFISIGLEPELVTTVGYLHPVGSKGKNWDLQVGTSLKFAPLIISEGAWRLNLINATQWSMSEDWATQFTSNVYWVHDNNRAGVMNGLGFEIRSTPMHYGKKWAKGIDLGWQYTALANIRNSSESRDTYKDRYPNKGTGIEGPQNGWYRAASNRIRIGFRGTKMVGDGWGFELGIGSHFVFQEQGILLGFSHGQVPLYLESTVYYQH